MRRVFLVLTFALAACRDSVAQLPDGAATASEDAAVTPDATAAAPDAAATTPDAMVTPGMDASAAPDAATAAGMDASTLPSEDASAPTADAGASTGLEPGPGDLVFVELQGNPQGTADTDAEYIEMLNVSGRALDLQGCKLVHRVWQGTGMAPVDSVDQHSVSHSVPVAIGARVMLTRSNGGYFGGAMKDEVYSAFELGNGGMDNNRVRLMAPGWDGTEPTDPAFLVDEIVAPQGTFDNSLRGRAWQLDPSVAADASSNDDPMHWCYAPSDAAFAYWQSNWGTPGAANACQ